VILHDATQPGNRASEQARRRGPDAGGRRARSRPPAPRTARATLMPTSDFPRGRCGRPRAGRRACLGDRSAARRPAHAVEAGRPAVLEVDRHVRWFVGRFRGVDGSRRRRPAAAPSHGLRGHRLAAWPPRLRSTLYGFSFVARRECCAWRRRPATRATHLPLAHRAIIFKSVQSLESHVETDLIVPPCRYSPCATALAPCSRAARPSTRR